MCLDFFDSPHNLLLTFSAGAVKHVHYLQCNHISPARARSLEFFSVESYEFLGQTFFLILFDLVDFRIREFVFSLIKKFWDKLFRSPVILKISEKDVLFFLRMTRFGIHFFDPLRSKKNCNIPVLFDSISKKSSDQSFVSSSFRYRCNSYIIGCSEVPSLLVFFKVMYVGNETLVSLYFSLKVPTMIYKMKRRPLETSFKIGMLLLLL